MIDVRAMTPGKRWKFKRNLAITQLSMDGWSQRQLADVFDLPRSRIAAIVKEVRELGAGLCERQDETDTEGKGRGAYAFNPFPYKRAGRTERG